MPIIVAVANQKGGCGKTTTCMNLGGGLAESGLRVLVVDADPQQSASQWRSRREDNALGFEIVSMARPTLHRDLPALAGRSSYQFILIDCPPGGAGAAPGLAPSAGSGRRLPDDITRSAVLACHAVLVPIAPSPLDYEAAHGILPLLREVAFYRPEIRVWVLINRKPPGARLGREARAAALAYFTDPSTELGTGQALKLKVLETEVASRIAFAECAGSGLTVLGYDSGSPAAEEVRRLTREVLLCLNGNGSV